MSHEWEAVEDGVWVCRRCRSLAASEERPHPLLPVWVDLYRNSHSCEEAVVRGVLES